MSNDQKQPDAPTIGAFEYRVSVQLFLPLPHAALLRETALHQRLDPMFDLVPARRPAVAGPIAAVLPPVFSPSRRDFHMLRPSEVAIGTPDHTEHKLALHKQFDKQIEFASTTGLWPAVVKNARDGLPPAVLDAVILEYRDAGWIVLAGSGDTRATIDHPLRRR